MARQVSSIKIQGSVDGLTFVQTADGYIVKKKPNISRAKIKTSAAFQRTRETMAEFGTAAKAGKLIRHSVPSLLKDVADGKLTSRLMQSLIGIIQTDAVNNRGLRSVAGGDVTLLEGFEFNIKSQLGSVMSTPFTVTANRTTGALELSITDFIPNQAIAAPAGTTHFKIVSAGLDVNFTDATTVVGLDDSGVLPYGTTSSGAITLTNSVTPNSTNPLFVLLGVRFYSEVNGVQYPLNDSGFNPLTVVKVSKA